MIFNGDFERFFQMFKKPPGNTFLKDDLAGETALSK